MKVNGSASVAAAAMCAYMTVVAAIGPADAADSAQAERASKVTVTANSLCKIGLQTDKNALTPPDDSTANNRPAGSITFVKPCEGPVRGQLTAELSTSLDGDFVHVDMLATCLAGAGQKDPCKAGQEVFASPGHIVMSGQEPTHSATATLMWESLPRGKWKFEALPGGNDSANLLFRTFTIEAYGD